MIISQATTLNKKQAALTDPKQIQANIDKWQQAASGQKPINGKSGKPLSAKYCKEKAKLFKKLLNNKQQNSSTQKSEQQNSSPKENDSSSQTKESPKEEGKKEGKQEQKIAGQIHVSTQGISQYVTTVKAQTTDDDAQITTMSKNLTISVGGEQAKQIINGNGQGQQKKQQKTTETKEEPKKQKKGLFSKLKDKAKAAKDAVGSAVGKAAEKTGVTKAIGTVAGKVKDVADKTGVTAAVQKAKEKADEVGNKAKQKIQKASGKIKEWYAKQNKWVKILIWVIIGILACLAIYLLITTFLIPLLYGLLHGGIFNAIAGAFRIYASGKTFVKTFQVGKKAWQSGQGWGQFFLLLIGSVFAVINLKQMADAGSAMMAADSAGTAGKVATNAAGNDLFDQNGTLNKGTLKEMIKKSNIQLKPGMDEYDVMDALEKNFPNIGDLDSVDREVIKDTIEAAIHNLA